MQAPGATASLVMGAGEFQAPFQRSLQIAKSLEKILENHPDLVFDMRQGLVNALARERV